MANGIESIKRIISFKGGYRCTKALRASIRGICIAEFATAGIDPFAGLRLILVGFLSFGRVEARF